MRATELECVDPILCIITFYFFSALVLFLYTLVLHGGGGDASWRLAGLNGLLSSDDRFHVAGHIWGSSTEDILALNGGARYDLIVLADTVYAAKGHLNQISSVCGLLARPENDCRGGRALVIWSTCAQQHSRVDDFFAKAAEYGLVCEEQPLGRLSKDGITAKLLRWDASAT